MTLDTTQILILALVAAALLDKAFAWYVVHLLAGGQRAPTFPIPGPVHPTPVPDPGPLGPPDRPPVVPDKPPVVVTPPVPPTPPAPGIPRFTGITTTSFAGVGDSETSKESAYYPAHYPTKVIDSNKPGAALPYHFPGTPPAIRVFCRGKTIDCPIVDVGPWNTNDAYWDHGGRPQAESGTDTRGRHTNLAGLDLTPGAWAALGKTGNLDAIKDITSWDFVSILDHGNPAPLPIPPIGPAHPPVGGTVLQHNTWPTQAEAESFYGNPASSGWEAAYLIEVSCPWEFTVEGTKSHTIRIHRKCAASLGRVLDYIWEQCGKSQVQIHTFGYDVFDGSYNYRQIRGGSGLSMHSYGIAMDWNAAANPQHAPLSQTKFKADSLIVYAFKQESWTWGGDWTPTSIDAMHFQAARVR